MHPAPTERPPRYGVLLLVACALWVVAAALIALAVLLVCVMLVLLVPDLMTFGDEPSWDGQPWWGWAAACTIGAGAALLLAVPVDAAIAVQAVRRVRRPGQERAWPILALATVGLCSVLPLLLAPLALVPDLLPVLVTVGALWLGVGLTARVTVAVHGALDLTAGRH